MTVELDELARTQRRMAARLRPGVGHRHLQPHPPGPQPGRLSLHQPRTEQRPQAEIEKTLPRRDRARSRAGSELVYVDVDDLPTLDRQFLVERQLISREHADSEGARGVAIDPHETVQPDDQRGGSSAHPGHAQRARPASRLGADQRASTTCSRSAVTYAFHEQLGYLTACPTNVGTGMRVSVMLHLPALVITQQIEKVFRSLQKISLAVRGLYGEGSQAMGDFYQISNQITLGRSEDRPGQAGRRRRPRASSTTSARPATSWSSESRKDLHDRVSRAYGILCTAQTISSEETMHLLSSVRMGVNLGLIQRPRDPDGQRAVHPHAAGPPAEAPRRGARHGRPQHRAGHLSAEPPQAAGGDGIAELNRLCLAGLLMSSNPYESPASLPPPPQPLVAPANVPPQSLESQVRLLFQQGANGANWFYWIAGLSLINSVITLVGGKISFVLGLAVTGITDQMAMRCATQARSRIPMASARPTHGVTARRAAAKPRGLLCVS